jgi:uncharacterized protein YecE (DUF72 family)
MGRRREVPQQLSLFGAGGAPSPRRVGPAPVSDELRSLGSRLPDAVYLGTSSWSFPGWEGLVYDRTASTSQLARHGLAAYARHPLLRAAGIDRTYYAPVPAETLAEYASAVPDGFRFLVKAASLCTDPFTRGARGKAVERNPLFLDAGFAADEVVGPFVTGLGSKGGALVFQFPPLGPEVTGEPARFVEALEAFLSSLHRGPVYAVELRDRKLFGAAYAAALVRAGAHHCFTAHPRMPALASQREVVGKPRRLVARWMLHSGLGYEAARERYAPFSRIVDEDPATRAALADLVLEQLSGGGSALVTANNKAEGCAPETLFRLAGAIVELFRASAGS